QIDQFEALIEFNGNSYRSLYIKDVSQALERGNAYLTNISRQSLTKIGEYFSKRNENNYLSPYEWKSDYWISKDDLYLSESIRNKIDKDNDRRISTNEFVNALDNGSVYIGKKFSNNNST